MKFNLCRFYETNNSKFLIMDSMHLCRCCMGKGSIEIFEATFQEHSLASIIERCTHTTICISDSLPRTICQNCFDTLIACYSFITEFLKTQDSLLKIFGENRSTGNGNIKSIRYNSGYDTEENSVDNSVIPIASDDEVLLAGSKQRESIDKTNSIPQPNDKIANSRKKEKNYSCVKCNKQFTFIKLLEKHCKDTGHPVPRRYSCETCRMKFSTKSCLKAHFRTHSKEKPHSCEECGMRFSLRSNLQRHKRRHTGEKAYFCEICGRGFIQKHTLIIHMRLHNGETPYVCQQCGKGYRAKALLTQHLKKHSGLETYYREHYLKHGSQKVECTVCKKLLTKSGLYTHMKIQHGDGLKKFLCNLCGKTYTSKKSLETHMNVHTKKITYSCDICSKSFSHHNYLKTHMRIHSGEKPHCCEICGRTFTQRAHLDGHMRTHTGVKPFTCNYCNKSFALNGNLKVHMRIHTGETPHYCSVCSKGFFDSSNKRKHEINVHNMHQQNVE